MTDYQKNHEESDEVLLETSDRLLALIGVPGEEASMMRKVLREKLNQLFIERGVKDENIIKD